MLDTVYIVETIIILVVYSARAPGAQNNSLIEPASSNYPSNGLPHCLCIYCTKLGAGVYFGALSLAV